VGRGIGRGVGMMTDGRRDEMRSIGGEIGGMTDVTDEGQGRDQGSGNESEIRIGTEIEGKVIAIAMIGEGDKIPSYIVVLRWETRSHGLPKIVTKGRYSNHEPITSQIKQSY
jgi:hypothetical protein